MELRLSGYEYWHSPRSSVSHCSLDSYIEYQKANNNY